MDCVPIVEIKAIKYQHAPIFCLAQINAYSQSHQLWNLRTQSPITMKQYLEKTNFTILLYLSTINPKFTLLTWGIKNPSQSHLS
ncbi:BgTH12-06128 [Blumeria graminis f. sp. triticale]|uniref:BgTH12-06128 n=1 Tax=Blumeria graminis f. sp. triticale TaxID=1689686 RepID=A0A9W4GH01_BLUGR|nr:BgTH12-06128 [Blumeria graminis f. sp. triticale]